MTIRTKESLSGFVASDPELTFTSRGDARLYARIGQPQAQAKDDGTFTQLEPTFTDLVMFRRSAELAHEQFQKGDNFLAEGETRTYTGSDGTEREQFVASRIGHDNNITRYSVDRSPTEREAPRQETPVREQVQQALTEREAQLDPEPPAATGVVSVQRDAVAR